DFVQCIKETLKPARGRELFAEKLEGLWDWQKFMEPMERVMSGVAILKSQPDVNYAFRIVTRKDMKLYSGYEKWVDMADEEHEALDQCPEGPADGDVFLLCKQFMHSTSLSQKPVLLMPALRAGLLSLMLPQKIRLVVVGGVGMAVPGVVLGVVGVGEEGIALQMELKEIMERTATVAAMVAARVGGVMIRMMRMVTMKM
ncbi:unnamed protein product, partial [Durusdinium trenchii]